MMLATRAVRPSSARLASSLLDADVVAVELQLIDEVGAGPRVGFGADGPAADRAGEHREVGAGVLLGEEAGAPGAARERRQEDDEKEEADRALAHRRQRNATPLT